MAETKEKKKKKSRGKNKAGKNEKSFGRRFLRGILRFLIMILIIAALYTAFANLWIIYTQKNRIVKAEDVKKFDYDAILVLGCSVKPDKSPSHMLADRLDTAYEVYKATGLKIIVSGDHRDDYYNEVRVMKDYLIGKGVPSEDIYMDHAGYSTYDSMYRAKNTFGASSVIVITQKYHLYRAIYVAGRMGYNAVGVDAEVQPYSGQFMRDMREMLSRDKAYIDCMLQVKPKEYGDKYSLSESGDLTDER